MSEDEPRSDPDPSDATGGDGSDATRDSPTERAEVPADDPFEEMPVESIDDAPAPLDAAGTDVAVSAEEHVVPKRTYCQECPHLSEPPSFVCTHEGTTIVELVDTEHVRVQNCPMVGEASSETALEAEDRSGAND